MTSTFVRSLVLVAVTAGTFALATAAALGADAAPKKVWHTYPMPPKVKPSDPMNVIPGVSVPENPERVTWKITAPKNEPGLTQVPVYYGPPGQRLSKIGNVPVGTEIKLDEMRLAGRVLYYSLKFTTESGKETSAWVSGNYIANAGPATLPAVQ